MYSEQDIQKEIMMLLGEYFKWDLIKMYLWLSTENPLLGNVQPIDMIAVQRSQKLYDAMKAMKEGEFP
jgi:hypothetical protein